MTKTNLSVKDMVEIIGTQKEMGERWIKRAAKLREQAQNTSEDSPERYLLERHALGIEQCAYDLSLWMHFMSIKNEDKVA